MKTLLKKIRTGAVILAVAGIVSPPTAWAGGSKAAHVASHSQAKSRPSNRVQVVHETKGPLTGIQRVVNAPGGNGPSGQVTIASATGGAGAGKIKFNEFNIKKTTDSASPTLFKSCASGSHYKKATIEMRKAGGDAKSAGKPYLKFKFDTVFTAKTVSSGPGDAGPKITHPVTLSKATSVVHRSGLGVGGVNVSQPKAASLVRRGGPGAGGTVMPPKPVPAVLAEYGLMLALISIACFGQ